VGAETVRKDNPRLTVRIGTGRPQPWRAVVTKSGKLPTRARLFTDAHRKRTLVYRRMSWRAILRDLHRRGVCRLLVEGGAQTAAGLIAAGKVNELIYHLSPDTAPGGSPRWPGWADPVPGIVRCRRLGKDVELRVLFPTNPVG